MSAETIRGYRLVEEVDTRPPLVLRKGALRPGSLLTRLILAEHSRQAYDATTIVKPLSSYTCKLTPEQAVALENYLKKHPFEFRQVPYAKFAAANDRRGLTSKSNSGTGS